MKYQVSYLHWKIWKRKFFDIPFKISVECIDVNWFATLLFLAGFNVETVEYKNISFTVWDVGGQDKASNLFH